MHYSKIISAVSFLFIFVNIGLPSTSFSVYQPYLVALDGIGDANASLILSVRTLCTLLAMFAVNWYYRRLDCRFAIAGGSALVCLGFTLYALAAHFVSLPLFFAGAAAAGFGYGLGGNVGMTLLTGRWYKTHVGTAVGIASVGSGVAGIVVPPVALMVINGISLAGAFAIEAVIAAIAAVVVAALVRNRPADMGLKPVGAEPVENSGLPLQGGAVPRSGTEGVAASSSNPQVQPAAPPPHLSYVAQAMMVAACACVGMVSVGAIAYMSILMTSNGYDHTFAAAMLSVVGITLTLSKFASGEVFDHFGIMRGTAVLFGVLVVGLALCCMMPSQSLVLACVASALFGAGAAVGSTGISVWSLALSGPSTRIRMVRNMQIGYNLGGFVGDTFPGFLAEACGSYVPTYGIILVTTALAAVLILVVCKKYVKA